MYLSKDHEPQENLDISLNSSGEVSSFSKYMGDTSSIDLQPPWIHVPPRTQWAVQDNKLKSRPPFFPPINPYTSTYIGDASPSILAVRISECLRKNNVIVEYDDEAATAHACTCDKVLLDITLHRGNKACAETRGADLSHGVVVECIRVQGDTISFHRLCHCILNSARGDSDGLDKERRKHGCFHDSPLGRWPMTDLLGPSASRGENGNTTTCTLPQRFYHFQPNFVESSSMMDSKSVYTATWGLNKALSLLEKDRYDAQTLGLQLLVMLTDTFSSRMPVAIYSSICVLGGHVHDSRSKTQVDSSSIQRIHDWIVALLIKREEDGPLTATTLSSKSIKSSKKVNEDTTSEWSMEHFVSLRTLALRVLVNALVVLVTKKDAVRNVLSSSQNKPWIRLDPFWTHEFLQNCIHDIRGAGRPPHTYLGSSNEAALSIRFLRFLAIYSKDAKHHLMQALSSMGLQEALDRAFVVGMSTHRSLEEECTLLLQLLQD